VSAEPSNSLDSLFEVAAVLTGRPGAPPTEVDLSTVGALGSKQLQEAARLLGLTGVSRLKKDALAQAVWEAWQAAILQESAARRASISKVNGSPTRGPSARTTVSGATVQRAGVVRAEPSADNPVAPMAHKFELQQNSPTAPAEIPQDIPWGYGRDRVTAMAVDPDRLFAYWEVLEESIARGRASLGPRGERAWLNLRVYDVTGRIFDGENAHGSFDQGVDRNARQWFFVIGKPGSEAIVEVGLRAEDGAFVKIARSGRVEFPRRDPVAWSEPEWLTVRAAGAEVVRSWMPSHREHAGGPDRAGWSAGADAGPGTVRGDAGEAVMPAAAWDFGLHAAPGAERVIERTEWEEIRNDGMTEAHRRVTWEEQSTISSWQEGPFSHPVEVPAPVFESFVGRTRVFRSGTRTRIVYGPWQVVIRGVGASSAASVISRWEVYRSWGEETGVDVVSFDHGGDEGAAMPGASERLLAGASERRWRGGSEVRLGGASELYRIGASELRLMGASEIMYAGASERLRKGASERRLGGASEWRVGGASEQRLGGAGAERLGGASEQRFIGASENFQGRPPTAESAYPASSEPGSGAAPGDAGAPGAASVAGAGRRGG
jgi:hypothetical protein